MKQSDFGVTLMRMGRYVDAVKRFRIALELDPGLDVAQQNLQELRRFHGGKDLPDPRPSRKQLHELSPIPRKKVKTLRKADFQKPFILEGAMDGWNATAFALPELARRFATARTDFYPHDMEEESVSPIFIDLRSALEWQMNSSAGDFPSYVQWNLDWRTW